MHAAWVVGDLLNATGESLAEFPTQPEFIRASIPAEPEDTDIESGHEVGNIPSSVGNLPTRNPGRGGGYERGIRKTPIPREIDQLERVAHLHTYEITIANEQL